MRILLFSNWLPPIKSGSSFYTSSLARSLLERGHEVVVVSLDWGREYIPDEGEPFTVYRLPVIPIPKLPVFYNLKLMGFACTPGNHRRLGSLVKKHGIQIIHHVNHIFDTTFLTANVARTAGIPIVGSITTPIQHQHPVMQKLMSVADLLTVGQFGVKRWDGIVSLDRTVHDYVGRIYGRKTQQRSVVIPFGVRAESMSDYTDRSVPRAERPQILMVGHIHPFRNPVNLVRALPRVIKEIPEVRLVLAGRVDIDEPVRVARELGLGEDRIKFLGETAHGEIVRLMKESHVYASWATGPFRSLGTAPMEAMLCGIPVINDFPEDLFGEGKPKNGENILLVDSSDVRSVADTIIKLLKDRPFRERIGSGGRCFVLEHLGWDKITEQMENFYSEMIARR
ncbi:MAG: glycosyltransferase family 4 protein [Candidatus Omnitrophica bacterium]|nr:glycosyltransferase family 4 protein [Candidatus Omnitrophota bacterium]